MHLPACSSTPPNDDPGLSQADTFLFEVTITIF